MREDEKQARLGLCILRTNWLLQKKGRGMKRGDGEAQKREENESGAEGIDGTDGGMLDFIKQAATCLVCSLPTECQQ